MVELFFFFQYRRITAGIISSRIIAGIFTTFQILNCKFEIEQTPTRLSWT